MWLAFVNMKTERRKQQSAKDRLKYRLEMIEAAKILYKFKGMSLKKRCHLPVEQTQDQRRTTFFGAVGNEAGNSRREPRIPVVHGGEYVKQTGQLIA